ncbi:MAG: hypothetical protein Q4C22_01870 [Bacillota bacterium]|nr:hypothetical protein [Bacillota bacterium]
MKKSLCVLLVCLMVLTLFPVASYGAGSYSVSAVQTAGGTISVSVSSAAAGQTVTGTFACNAGYDVATVRYEYNGSYQLATLSGGSFSFTMPAANVQIAGAFFSTTVWDGAVDISWYDPAATEYTISEPAELAGLAALVNGRIDADTPEYRIKGDASYIKSIKIDNVMLVGAGGGNVADTVYSSETDFAYKTVRLGADLDMGGRYRNGAWSGPNYTPVGGKFSMDTDMVNGDSYVIDTRFNGVFDGQGHSVSNIYCQRYAEKGFPYSMAIGLIGFLGGESDVDTVTGTFENGWQPAVRNVVVGEGYIYGRRMVGGVVGRIGETNNGVIVENCANFAQVKNTDAKGVGGIVGAGWGDGMIRNCYNVGDVSTIFSCPAGGIVGSNSGLDIYNCYNVGNIDTNGASMGRGIGGHDSGAYTVDNCYYLADCDDNPDSQGYYKGSSTKISINVQELSESQMKESSFAARLNVNGDIFVADSAGLNNGYPVLYFQSSSYSGTGSCNVTVVQSAGGVVSADKSGSVAYGQVVNLSAQPEAGYTLRYYTVNGQRIDSSFYTVTGDVSFGAVFERTRTAVVTIREGAEQEISVIKTGYLSAGGTMSYVYDEPVKNGDVLQEGDVLTVRAGALDGAVPEDPSREYTEAFTYELTNVEVNLNGTYTVTGEGNVTIEARRGTQEKTWLSVADTSWYRAGESVYTLSTAAELAGMAYLVNVKGITFSGKTVLLDSDISLANADGTQAERIWKAIGVTTGKSFQGVFDGQGHSIVDMNAYNTGSYAGLFGYCIGAVVRNVTVEGTTGCEANTAYAAGIVSYAASTEIRDCVSRVQVETDGANAGGIAAYISEGSVVAGCRNYGTVRAASGAGGIVGIAYSATDLIEDCVNFGAVTGSGNGSNGAGGIAGKLAGTARDCANTAEISGTDRYIGGVVGYANGRRTSVIENCVNTGSVSCSNATSSAAVGGIVGYLQYGTLTGDVNTGSVRKGTGFAGNNAGAVAGRLGTDEINVSDCRYLASSAAGAAAGGSLEGASAESSLSPGEYLPEEAAPVSVVSETVSLNPLGLAAGNLTGNATVTADGTYYLKWYSAGTIEIGGGAKVTLVGTGKEMGPLTIHAGSGSQLTLRDVSSTGSKTLLVMEDGSRLILEGSSSLVGTNDESDMQNPTVLIKGKATVDGSGILYARSEKGDAAIVVSPGGELEIAGGIVSAFKEELMGQEGGTVYAAGATVRLSGGALVSRSDTDNVSALSAERFVMTAGSLNALCDKSTHTIDVVSGSVSGGMIRALGHSGNSDADNRYYYKESSVNGLSGSISYYDETTYFQSATASPQNITYNGNPVSMEVYNIDGNNYFKLRDVAALMDGTGSGFSLGYDANVRTMYAVKGESYEAVGGELALPEESKAASCTASVWTLYVDGELVSCRVYNIGGNNFFKLRDLGTALSFDVSYDESTNTAAVRSR